MKNPTGNAKPRRLAAPKPRKRTRLDLKRRPDPEPEGVFGVEKKSSFWNWVGLVALLHLLGIGIACLVYQFTPAPKPPEQFISLLPEGDIVKGTPGAQQAHKIGPTTSAPKEHHHASTPPSATKPPSVKPPPIKPLVPPPMLTPPQLEPSPNALDKPVVKPPPPKPTPPKPKVKVDLTLADGPNANPDKPKVKHHTEKPPVKPTEDNDDSPDSPDSAGLSREQIAAKLGDKLDDAGVKNATNHGTSGAANTRANSYADFYAMIRDQVMSQWQSPNLSDETAVNPVVQIHVEKDGRVPAEFVHLIQSSGNTTYDDSAVEAAKNLGYLHDPLPDGCPPDIPITFKLTR